MLARILPLHLPKVFNYLGVICRRQKGEFIFKVDWGWKELLEWMTYKTISFCQTFSYFVLGWWKMYTEQSARMERSPLTLGDRTHFYWFSMNPGIYEFSMVLTPLQLTFLIFECSYSHVIIYVELCECRKGKLRNWHPLRISTDSLSTWNRDFHQNGFHSVCDRCMYLPLAMNSEIHAES